LITNVVSFGGNTFSPNFETDFMQGTEPGLPPGQAAMLTRIGAWPVVAALQRNPKRVALLIKIVDLVNVNTLRSQLFRWFDPEDETPKKLIVTNHASIQQYVMALCEGLSLYKDPRHQDAFVAILSVDGDVRWRSEAEATPTPWAITASGQTHAIVNNGEDEAYPVYTIQPTTVKGSSYTYRRWVPIQWSSVNAGQQYPVMATLATNALIPAKMQALGEDLRVLVDGVEVYRWLDAINTAATKIWFTTDFAGSPVLTLKTAIAPAGSIASIEVNEDINQLPETGILYIGTEAFVYSARNTTDKLVSGVERAAKGTSAGAHNSGVSVYWIQHDIYILYGNAAATAPVVEDAYKPCFELDHSANDSWVYEVFGESTILHGHFTVERRAARWEKTGPMTEFGLHGVYTATQKTFGNPYDVAGAWKGVGAPFNDVGWQLSNPCGIKNVTWTNGLKRRATTNPSVDFLCHLMYWPRAASWWNWQYTLVSPTLLNTWEAWSYGPSGADFNPVADTIYIGLYAFPSEVEVGDVTVTLNDAETPVVTVNAEQGNYHLQGTLTNQDTGESITLDFVMDVNSEIEIDTASKTVIWLLDGSRQFQALTTGGTRATPLAKRNWLRLLPGSNTLRFDDTGTGNVTLTTEFRERFY
jgi:hypothetical protein